ncbi:MAG: hypothetical protein NT075_02025 [Chloroflexi bacterium]|nr:hypothetical protein [Chloroflexota bacterium]
MTTAVVVTSIVTTNLGEARFVDHILEQIRRNDRNLLNRLNKVDGDARVVTAILNVGEFMTYAQEVLREREALVSPEWAFSEPTQAESTDGGEQAVSQTTVVTAQMNELEFMDYTLGQLRQENVASLGSISEQALDEIEEERIGEEFSRTPFLY